VFQARPETMLEQARARLRAMTDAEVRVLLLLRPLLASGSRTVV
jgi:hypothetical protein